MSCFTMIFIALSSTLLLQSNLNSAQTYADHSCLGENYTANSIYKANIDLLLSSITINTTLNSYLFVNKSVGGDAGRVYAVFQCRGDYTSEECKRFAVMATTDIKARCPYNKEAIIFYDECWLHYSNSSLSTVQFRPTTLLYRRDTDLNSSLFTPKRTQLLGQLVSKAVAISAKSFAVGKVDISSSEKMYGLVQCIQNLPKSDCSTCLTRSVSEFAKFKYANITFEGSILKPSCIAMFAENQFFLSLAQAPPPRPPSSLPPPTPPAAGQKTNASQNIVIKVVPAVIVALLLFVIPVFIHLCRKKGVKNFKDENVVLLNPVQSLQLDFSTVQVATGNFSDANKLGKGGFGAVYKGMLPDGREIAVKRLAQNSVQGGEEFKNEVVLLCKLEHRNLVKLLGFCLEGDERLLIYEFLRNASLDHYLFDAVKVSFLNWETRYKIIRGIARGLLYLHEDSHLMIIHRDIKASNVLLDEKMNPKISDFGMARLFMLDQTHGNTKRIVGTLGYMAPEYAYNGNFSVKADVFSFGVLVLEIISGRKNNRYYESQCDEYLLSYAWKHLVEGTSLKLVEPSMGESYSQTEAIRCIHIGLLCVQEDVAKRPTMASVVVMLNRNTVTLPLPSAPAFFLNSVTKGDMISDELKTDGTCPTQTTVTNQSTCSATHPSVNEMSVTELCPR